jgi:hypothetical protein
MNFTSPDLDVLDLRLKGTDHSSPASPRHKETSSDTDRGNNPTDGDYQRQQPQQQQQQDGASEVHSGGASASSSPHEGSVGTVLHLLEEDGIGVGLRGMGPSEGMEASMPHGEVQVSDDGSSDRSEQDHVAELGEQGRGRGSGTGQALLQRASSGVAALTQDALGWNSR